MSEEKTQWKWKISPHPYSNDYDSFVTDDDNEARDAIWEAAELWLWEQNDGEERTLTVIHNPTVKAEQKP